ncbi:MAG: hypothetical protein FK734_10765 [Asgard group archaeon]|nr:hypothetical protein [Asgard group archaeon]
MKNTRKKLVGGFFVALLIAVIGAVIVSAETEEITDDESTNKYIWDFGRRGHMEISKNNLFYELTDEQEEELIQLKQTMIDKGATCEEIQEAVMEKLDEWGILDKRLDEAIEQTELRLEILNRQKELREQGYSWEEINSLIQEEFELEGMFLEGEMFGHGFGHGGCRSPR